MKKQILIAFIVLACTLSLAAERKKINVLAAFGVASSGFEDVLIDVGLEVQLNKSFYVQVVANSHLEERRYGDYWNDPYYYGPTLGANYGYASLRMSFGFLHGFGTYAVIKPKLARKLHLFAKAGMVVNFYKERKPDYDLGRFVEHNTSGFGVGLGTGLQYQLAEKLNLVGGFTYRRLFKKEPVEIGEQIDYFKTYVGLTYRLR